MGEPNWANRTVWTRDCLEVMRGMNSESVDLIYLDPPFNSKVDYSAPVGSKAAGAAFRDTWTLRDVDVEWVHIMEARHPALYRVLLAAMTASDKSYLAYMAVRLLEMRRILKPSGSIYLHCDPTMSHYLKLTMDAIFGRWNLVNEIIWHYPNASRGKKRRAAAHDVILWFRVGDTCIFQRDDVLTPYTSGMTAWRYAKKGLPTPKGKTPDDVVSLPSLNTMAKERTGYPTQKPLDLLLQLLKGGSSPDSVILDPFCGCATTMVAANALGRQWAGIDLSAKAGELVKQRMQDRGELFGKTILRTDIPKRTDLGPLPRPRTHKAALYGQQAGNCNWCRTHFEIGNLEVDHVIARAAGGTDHLDNLQLLCARCNRVKGARGMEYLRAKLQLENAR